MDEEIQLPNITTVSLLVKDRSTLSKLKRVKDNGRMEADYEVLNRLLGWQLKTRKQKIQDLIGNDVDPRIIEDAVRD